MEINKVQCDKCGKEIKFTLFQRWIRGKIVENKIVFSDKGKKVIDLCDTCMPKLIKWLSIRK